MFARLLLVWMLAGIIGACEFAWAEDFRIVTKVYSADRIVPDSENTTLFRSGRVYDFLSDPMKITIFDKGGSRFVMLDPVRKIQTELTLAELKQSNQQIVDFAAQQKNDLLNSLANPAFQQRPDPNTGATIFSNAQMTYAVKSAPAESKEMFEQYDEFADLFVQLNNMISLPTRPPYGLARLAVNKELRKTGEIPTEVKLTVFGVNRAPLLNRNLVLKSEHRLTPMLSQSDQKEIEKVEQHVATFTSVKYGDFVTQPLPGSAQKPGARR